MASRWKKPSVLSKYLRSRSRSVGGAGPRGRRLPKRHGFQVRVRFSDNVDSGLPGSSNSIQSNTMDVEDNMGEVWGSSDGEDENVMQCHRQRKKRSYRIIHTREQEAWEKLHPSFIQPYTSSLAIQPGQLCMYCSRLAEYRCQDCSALAFFCEDCCKSQHQICNIFHVPEKWVSDYYCSSPLFGLTIPLTHDCPTMYKQKIA